MHIKRYCNSFFIASVFYSFLIITLLYSFEDTYTTPIKKQYSTQNVQFTLINLPKKIERPKIKQKEVVKKELKPQPKKIVKKIKKKIIKKINPKKIAPREIIKKLKPPIKPMPEIDKIVTKIVEKPIKNITNKIVHNQIEKNNSILKEKTIDIDTKQLKIKKNQYYTQIKQTINKNKSYPKVAVRRGIQGNVEIQFSISKTGKLLSFKILNGKKIFFKSIQKAVKNSFPLIPPSDLFTSSLDLKLTLQYKLY